MKDVLYVIAKLKLYKTENGGRQTPINTGYRPSHVFEYKENSRDFVAGYMGQINFDIDVIHPGEVANVEVMFLKHQNIESFLKKGRVWWIHEGSRVIGKAKILEVLNVED
ncbi:hypothetical protein [Kordia sp.]|uniref:hypothetical protein n=1 Tax=Kordia sp. TaxID=1965332 RepID=UPI003D6A1AD7